MGIDRKCINTIPFNTDKSRMLRILPARCTQLKVLLYVSNRRRGSIPKIMLVNNYERKVDSTWDLIPIEIKEEMEIPNISGIQIEQTDLVQLKYWIEDNVELLLKYWECEIDYNTLCTKIISAKKKKKQELREKRKEREKQRQARDAEEAEKEKKRKMCYGKKAYSSLEAARKTVKKCNRERNTQTYIYMCPLCGMYHLTSHPREGTLYL